eukprot:gene13588-biopygen11259
MRQPHMIMAQVPGTCYATSARHKTSQVPATGLATRTWRKSDPPRRVFRKHRFPGRPGGTLPPSRPAAELDEDHEDAEARGDAEREGRRGAGGKAIESC